MEAQERRGRPNSDGGIGVVQKKKKRKTGDDGEVIVNTQDSTTSTAYGETCFQIKYTLDNRVSQDVDKRRVNVA